MHIGEGPPEAKGRTQTHTTAPARADVSGTPQPEPESNIVDDGHEVTVFIEEELWAQMIGRNAMNEEMQ
jgi:hypothetical protein